MRLVWLNLRHFRRFQDARVNLDAPVIALVGPNEAGKSTLLEAIVAVGRSGEKPTCAGWCSRGAHNYYSHCEERRHCYDGA